MNEQAAFPSFIWRNPMKNEQNSMRIHQKEEVVWLSFPMFDAEDSWLMNAFSTRLGGVSRDHLSSMNLGISRGDDPENVRKNFAILGEAAGFDSEAVVMSQQEHTTNIHFATGEDKGKGVTRPRGWTDIDGFVTNEPGVVLFTSYADCVPLFFADPVHHAIGLSHSGWRGTAQRMGEATIRRMTAEFGSNPKDILAAIGPSICQSCYEVSEDVALQFPEDCLKDKGNGKYLLNLEKANYKIFLESGITEAHISTSGLCTSCNKNLLFSHRASKGMRGNLGGFLEIRE